MAMLKSFVKNIRFPGSRAFCSTLGSDETWERGLVPENEWQDLSQRLMSWCDRCKLPRECDLQRKYVLPLPYNQLQLGICMHAAALTSGKFVLPEDMKANDLDLQRLVEATGEPDCGVNDNHRSLIHTYLLNEGANFINAKGRVRLAFEGLPRVEYVLSAIASGRPVVTECAERFDFLGSDIYMGEHEDDEDYLEGHEVTAIGYKLSKDFPPYIRFINSYGPKYGVDGIGKVYMGVSGFSSILFTPKLVEYLPN